MRQLTKNLQQTENYQIPGPPKQIGPKKKQLTEILAFIKRKQNKIWIFFCLVPRGRSRIAAAPKKKSVEKKFFHLKLETETETEIDNYSSNNDQK